MDYKALHFLSYGLYIVASEYEGIKSGYIANTVFQLTSEPVRLAISCNKNNYSSDIILKSGAFTVSVLKENPDMKLIGNFGFNSSSDLDKFADVEFKITENGMPLVRSSSLAWFDCKVEKLIDVETHTLIIGQMVDCGVIEQGDPLTYAHYREKYHMLSPVNAPTYIDPEKLKSDDELAEVETLLAPDNSGGEHVCVICGYHYLDEEGDPSLGIPAGTPFASLPDDYRCPICNAGKDYFREV